MGEKKLFIGIFLMTALALLLPLASAHGIFLVKENGSYVPGGVSSEFTAINNWGGVENLILAITIEPAENSLWIVPIPSKDVRIKEYKGYPKIFGPELKVKAQDRLASTYEALFAAQIYPLPYLSYFSSNFSIDKIFSLGAEPEEDILEVDSRAAWTSIVKAENFEEYFATRKADLSIPELDGYVNEGYSFAVSWLPNTTTPMTRSMFISFDTDRTYYPLKLSRHYGSRPPTWIYVVGDKTFSLGDLNKTSIATHHYNAKFTPKPEDLEFFFNNKSARAMDFNKIFLGPSGADPDYDLWFSDVAEENSAFLRSIVKHPVMWGIIVYIFLSCLSSLIAGAISFPDDEPKLLRFFFFGFSNVLTLIGFWTRAYFKDVYDEFTNKRTLRIDQWVDLTPGKRVAIAVPTILLALTIVLIPITMILELDSIFLPMFTSSVFVFYFIPVLVFTIMILWGAFHQKQVLKFNLIFTFTFFVLLLMSFMAFAFFF